MQPAPDLPQIIAEVADRLLSGRRHLVTAESCTGGWVAKICTDLPGSSRWFRGGVVAYTNELKTALLGVPPQTLLEEGAVSEAAVRAMAAGALERLGGDVAVAVSGIAGPDGGTTAKPVGTVWLAWGCRTATRTDVRTAVHVFQGDREQVRLQAAATALRG
ncbi:MAG: CinA family protein, partial [Steroidobacteraceae bacterium]|nr:CinA family protein [Steroidobacteraceae bacterium]